jgi:acetyl esterase/lipase
VALMFFRIGCMTLILCLVLCERGRSEERSAAQDVTVIRDICYRAGPGSQWRLDLAMKSGKTAGPRPAIVVIHGGGWLEGDKSSFASNKNGMPGNIVDFARVGFVAAAINYRLSGEAPYPAALEDCKCAIRWLREHARQYQLDPNRIGAFGNSAGGHLALLLGLGSEEIGDKAGSSNRSQSCRVQAVVSDSGPIDLLDQYRNEQLREVVSRFLGGPPVGERLRLYQKASPMNLISPDAAPLLLIYGVADAQVPVETADRFVLALGRAGLKDVSYYRLSLIDHCPYSLVRVASLRAVVDDFFLRTLRHQSPVKAAQTNPLP